MLLSTHECIIVQKETRTKFCTPFEIVISKGEFASKSHTNGTAEQDGVALGCKTEVHIKGNSRSRRQADGGADAGIKFYVLSYSTGELLMLYSVLMKITLY